MSKNPTVLVLAAAVWILAASAVAAAASPQEERGVWRVPSRHARKENPVTADAASLAAGKALFARECLSCHGETGIGNGPAAKDLEVKPADLSRPEVRELSDGALFWMIGTGRSPMPSFKDSLLEQDRWSLVNYLRTFRTKGAAEDLDPLAALVGHYQGLAGILAGTEWEPAAEAAAELVKAAKAAAARDPRSLPEKERKAWPATAKGLQSAVVAVAAAEDLEGMRAAFASLSDGLAEALKAFPREGRAVLRRFRCDEALDGKGATWLQAAKGPVNPYLPSHPKCGKLQELIPAPPLEKEQ